MIRILAQRLALAFAVGVAVGIGAPTIAAPAPPRTIDELRAVIAAHPDDPAVGARLTELAETLLAQLTADAADTAVFFGVPTDEQVGRVAQVAPLALAAARQASESLEAGLSKIAADPAFADSQELQNLRSELAVEYQLIRLPLVSARASSLIAATASDAADALRSAHQAADALGDLEDEDSPAAGAGHLILRSALTRITGKPMGKRHRAALIALARPDSVRSFRRQSPAMSREVVVAAALALAQQGQLTAAHQLIIRSVKDDPSDPLSGVVRRDALARLAIGAGARTRRGGASASAVGRAVIELTRGAQAWSESLVRLAIAKAKHIAVADLPVTLLTPAAKVVVGVVALERSDLDAAVGALADAWSTLGRRPSALSAVCGWSYAAALRKRGSLDDIVRGAEVLRVLSGGEVDAARSIAALDSSIALLQWAADARRREDNAEKLAAIESSLREALRQGLSRPVASAHANGWRLTLADLSTGAERRDLLEHVQPGGGAFPRAQLALAWMTYAQLRPAASDAQRDALAFTMLTLANQARDAAKSLDAAGAADLAPMIAQGRAVALAWLRRFDEATDAAIAWDGAQRTGAPDAVDAVRQRAGAALRVAIEIRSPTQAKASAPALEKITGLMLERIARGDADRALVDSCAVDLADALGAQDRSAQLAETMQPWVDTFGMTRGVGVAMGAGLAGAGENERAFQVFRDVVDASRALDVADEYYWRAWVGMIELLDAQNADGGRAESILRQIARLRGEDSTLGGALTRRRFERIEQRLGRTNSSP